MEGNKILDLSKLSDEHAESVQKAVYQCMGSGEPGAFAFVSHKECEQMIGVLKQAFSKTLCKGMLYGAAALAAGYCVGFLIDTTVKRIKFKKSMKEFEKFCNENIEDEES